MADDPTNDQLPPEDDNTEAEERKRRPVVGWMIFIGLLIVLVFGALFIPRPEPAAAPAPTDTPTDRPTEAPDPTDEPEDTPTPTETPTDTPTPTETESDEDDGDDDPQTGNVVTPTFTWTPTITETPEGDVVVEFKPVWDCVFAVRLENGQEIFNWYEAEVTYVDGVAVSVEIVSELQNGYWQPGCPLAPADPTEAVVTPSDEEPVCTPPPGGCGENRAFRDCRCVCVLTGCTYGVDTASCTCIIG